MTQSILIIGAGIAGLSAGCYGQMNGYRTRIFELHDKPGGLCTAWKRSGRSSPDGYTFDGCIEWLTGSTPETPLYRIWQELGAAQGRQFIRHDVYQRVEGGDGRVLSMYTDIDRLERHMRELAPADASLIKEFCRGARRFARSFDVLSDYEGPSNLLEAIQMGLKMLPLVGVLRKYGKMSTEAFAARFSDPLLRRAFSAVIDDLPDMPAMTLMMILGIMHAGDGAYPAGGSLAFARAVERRYLDLGGEIHYKSRVERILVEAGHAGRADRAVGVRLEDGTEHRADVVISAADGHATIYEMLGGQYVSDKVQGYYECRV
jgi:phytoene dehydrogenase-like protein